MLTATPFPHEVTAYNDLEDESHMGDQLDRHDASKSKERAYDRYTAGSESAEFDRAPPVAIVVILTRQPRVEEPQENIQVV